MGDANRPGGGNHGVADNDGWRRRRVVTNSSDTEDESDSGSERPRRELAPERAHRHDDLENCPGIGTDFGYRGLRRPYDMMYNNPQYIREHDTHAAAGRTRDAQLDPRRLLCVGGQDPDSVGYYDQRNRLVQSSSITSTTTPRTHDRGFPLPDSIYGLNERVNHSRSNCRWDPRQNVPLRGAFPDDPPSVNGGGGISSRLRPPSRSPSPLRRRSSSANDD